MALFLRKFPFNDLIVILRSQINKSMGRAPQGSDKDEGKATDELAKWSESIERQSSAAPVAPDPAEQLTGIVASDSGTIGGAIPAGLYAVYAYREVIIADPVSSSLALVIGWTHNGKALTRTLTAFAGAPQTINDTVGDVAVIEIDPNTSISYTLTYASNTPALAEFQVSLLANLLQTIE